MDLRRTVAPALAALGLGALALAACTPGDGSPAVGTARTGASPVDDRPVALATFTVLADIAGEVAGDHVRVESLTPVGAEIHGYEPTPRDVARAADADLVLENGLGLEAWLRQLLADSGAPHAVLSDGVETRPIVATSAGDTSYDGLANPHAWMSPTAAETYVDNVVVALSDLDPAHADEFAANGRAYRAEIAAVREQLVADLAVVPPQQRVLVTCEGAFSYLAADVGLEEIYLWPVNAESQSTPRQVAAAIDAVTEREVPAVFCESTVSDAGMRQVAQETGATFGGTLYVDSLSEPGGPVPTYLDLLRHDAETIAAGLTGAAS